MLTHLHGERFEPHKTKILDERAYSHVQSRIPGRTLRESVLEMGKVLDFGIKVQIEV